VGRTVVELDDRLVEAAQALAEQQGVTLSSVIDQAVREYVDAVQQEDQPSLIGLIDVPATWTQGELDQELMEGVHPREGWCHDADAMPIAHARAGSSRT